MSAPGRAGGAAQARGAEIRDLGYTPYQGTRTPPSRRFLVVARNVVGVAWRSRWGVKVPVILAIGTTLAAAVVMYFLRGQLFEMARARGAPIPRADTILVYTLPFYELSAFVLAAVVGCATIANDLRMGAFQFYFSRPLRPRDYVLGKLLGLALVVGMPMFAGPVVLALVRLLFSENLAAAGAGLPVLGKALVLGLVGTAAFVLPPLGLGALLGKRQPAQALYAVYFLLVSNAALGMSIPLHLSGLRLVSLQADVALIGQALFGMPIPHGDPSPIAAASVVAAVTALGFVATWWRVRDAETAGLGGA